MLLTPGTLYNVGLAYFNYTTATVGNIQLLWRRAGGALEVVPRDAIHARGRRDYYSFGGAVVAMKEGVISSATRTLTYLHGDHLGSTSLTTDGSGNVVSQQRYKPYGEVRWSSGAGMPTDKQFTSQTRLAEGYVGTLYDYVARAYDPVLGRFISADTIVPGAASSQAFNRYMYVLGNPLANVDKDGHCPIGSATLGVLGIVNCVGLDVLVFVGLAPDLGGIANATVYAGPINAAASDAGVPAIYVAAGIAMQSHWCCSLGDAVQIALKDLQGGDSSQGIAQLTKSEMMKYAGGQSRFWNPAGIEGMSRKVGRAAELCEGCNPTDMFILVAIGQNGFDFDPSIVLADYRRGGSVGWGKYFEDVGGFKETADDLPGKLQQFNMRLMAQGRNWNLHILKKFYMDVLALMKLGWALPEGVDLEYVGCLVNNGGGAACDASR